MTDEELCPCGRPLHYTNADTRAYMDRQIAMLGSTVEVSIGDFTCHVPRHYIALHGLHGRDIRRLAKQFNWETRMKANPHFTTAQMIEDMANLALKDSLPSRVDMETGEEVPTPVAERVEMKEAFMRMVQAGKIRTICIACHLPIALTDSTPCACGGFVCHACRGVEVEGECDHEPLVSEDDDD